jgi:tetratricopeptide (TPR) repeat protein
LGEGGAPEGDPALAPEPPKFTSDWQLGAPDLVLTMPKAYELRAEGPDVYRNFVLPVPIDRTRYVRAVEFRPGNPKIVHHVFIKLDRTEQSRSLDGEDNQPGFGGLQVPAEIPDGHLLGWQPGRGARALPEGMAFRIDPGNDFVLQMHLNPSGKVEELQSSLGLHFTDQPPTKISARIELTSYTIDIPAGATNYLVEDSLVLPVDAQLLAVLPHAHYLARQVEGWAELPNGTRESLILINRWDFNWQTDYRYARPIDLPKGTRLAMRWKYDNSTNNVRNPNNPPKEVMCGARSAGEMAELWFQLVPKKPGDLPLLNQAREANGRRRLLAEYMYLLQKNPNDPRALTKLGLIRMSEGKMSEARRMLSTAVEVSSDYALAHYNYGLLLRHENQPTRARREFERVLELEPKNAKAHGNLGFIFAELGDRASSESHFAEALRVNPFDELAKDALAQLRAQPAPSGTK